MTNLDLIDWRLVGFSAAWILGLAVVLAALGFADFQARLHGRRFRDQVRLPAYQAPIDIGLALFCLGMAGSAGGVWEVALWGALAAGFVYLAARSVRRR
jgi:hypothetical protein